MSREDRADQFLSAIEKTAAKTSRARLKIFLGMAAGVGKTFEMLQQAHRIQSSGRKVLLGVVETHGRVETEALLKGLPLLAKTKTDHRGTQVLEMDLDEILRQKPDLALVDELAHTNAPGSRNQKRYQDVIELLDAGINVFTTLNVQHIESRIDTVQQMTGINIRETVPDSIIDRADDIELVDLLPDMLIDRLREGKVYLGDRAEAATQNFFQKGKLTALREMALRLTADRVDSELSGFEREREILRPLKTSNRLMVAIGPSPSAETLIRSTRRAAYNLQAPWHAVYIETTKNLGDEDRKYLAKNMALAEDLGGQLVSTADSDVVRGLLRVAKQHHITQIIIGKPAHGKFRHWMGDPSPIPRLLMESGSIDITLIDNGQLKTRPYSSLVLNQVKGSPAQYLFAAVHILVATGICAFLAPLLGYSSIGLILLLNVLVQGLFLESGPIFLSALIAALTWDYFFIPPRFMFSVSKPEDILLLFIFFFGALFVGFTASRLSTRERLFSKREKEANSLFELSRDLAQCQSLKEMVSHVVKSLGGIMTTEVALFIKSESGAFPEQPHEESGWMPSAKEITIAHYAFDHRKQVGKFTSTLREAEGLHIPLVVGGSAIGVLAIRPKPWKIFNLEQLAYLDNFSHTVAIAVQKELLKESEFRAKTAEASEALQQNIFHSISHELRTPITAISGAASQLKESLQADNKNQLHQLGREIEIASDRLNRLIENLLDISRLDSGHLRPKWEWVEAGDLISVSLKFLGDPRDSERIRVRIAPGLPLLHIDFVLMEQVVINLIHNALLHTPQGTPIEVEASSNATEVLIQVRDGGPGISEENLPKIFDRFFRGTDAGSGGLGLGLSICKGFVEAMNGKISVQNLPTKGAEFLIRLPILEVPQLPKEFNA